MKNTKRIVALVLTVAMMTTLFAACGKSSSTKKTYKIGICQLVQHEALDAATKGFEEELTKKLGKDNVTFDLQNAGGESSTCATITNGFVSDGVDLIMANATPALQAAVASTGTIPILGTSVTDYGTALDIDNWTGTTGMNVSGTSDLAPLDQQANMIKELVPDAKTVGILYCSAEPNSKYQATEIEKTLKELGLSYKEYTAADTNDLASVTTTACSECDVLYIPTDNTIASATSAVNEIAAAENIPIIAGEEGICKGCGIATLSISYYDLGVQTADMAYDILVNGKDPSTMKVQTASKTTKEYVASRCKTLGITVPSDYTAIEEDA